MATPPSGAPLTLRTERFTLRTLTPDDASQRYVAWLNDPEVTRHLTIQHQEHSLDSTRSYIEAHDNRHRFLFGIFDHEGTHIGNFSLRCDFSQGNGYLGVMVGDKEYWGKKVVIETRSAILDFAFKELGLEKMCGWPTASNAPAIYNYRKQRWSLDGVLKRHFVSEGERIDVIMFAMFSEDWLSQ